MVASAFPAELTKWCTQYARLWIRFAVWSYLARTVDADAGDRAKVAHAVVGSTAWAFVFPVGALTMRLAKGTKAWFLHAAIQTLGLALITVGAGNGIYVALTTDQLNAYHPIIGLALLSLAFIQAAGGCIAHMLWNKHHRRNVIGRTHAWLGRAVVTLGMINGGLGLLLSEDGTAGDYIAYGVVAGVIWVLVVANAVVYELKGWKEDDTRQRAGRQMAKPDIEVELNER